MNNNNGAAQILTDMIQKGDVVKDINGNYVAENKSDASILQSEYND